GAGNPPPIETRYIYEGRNVIAEFSGTNALAERKYLWGLDLSQTLNGAGGVGALLAVEGSSSHSLPLYDGNGNIIGYADAVTGIVQGTVEYSLFGEKLLGTGNLATIGGFGFSTKPEVGDTGLQDFGFRHFDRKQGRWLSPDPSGEN